MSYQSFDVDVAGGALRVGRWGSGHTVIYGAHGLTANHRAFAALAALLGREYSLVAPDLRGRGASAAIAGPFGLPAHADDAVAVLDHLGVDRAVFVGHAIGGYAVTSTAVKHRQRVERLILVDGGIPFAPAPAPGTDIDQLVRQSMVSVLDRLDATFCSVDQYLDMWRRHPAVGPYWNDVAEKAYQADLVGDPPALRPSANKEAVIADCITQLTSSADIAARLSVPTTMIWAERGLADQTPGLYTPKVLEPWHARLPQLRLVRAGGENHVMLPMSQTGAKLIADVITAG